GRDGNALRRGLAAKAIVANRTVEENRRIPESPTLRWRGGATGASARTAMIRDPRAAGEDLGGEAGRRVDSHAITGATRRGSEPAIERLAIFGESDRGSNTSSSLPPRDSCVVAWPCGRQN